MPQFHPELTRARFIPRIKLRPWLVRIVQRIGAPAARTPDDMTIEDRSVPGPPGQPAVRLRLYRPKALRRPAPALYWIHGGGFVQGRPEQDDRTCIAFARELGIVVASVDYRLAPGHPFPAPLDDVYAGLQWLAGNAAGLGVDPRAVAIGGASAGGGLAAGLALLARDRGVVSPVFQLLVYPMLDDRTVLRDDVDTTFLRAWTPQNNRFGWTAYLGREPGGAGVSDYAAPARCEDLAGLPPAWIGVGTNDLFHDEDLDYARRLREAGVACDLTVVDGAFHGFDAIFTRTGVAQAFLRAQIDALRPTAR
ncbi:alpha/beta hydrolase fold domain-containing protein [Dactylosporangium sp. NBC_01737]|uniref:alpha/beta hydrolase n=1 Tax=Dactylosporangium sp. NBC_01737 TaxID=2975959 RepID=UPI002E10EE48|nr:alpha/beta hydrolase fold domain-containing protein [Dactylosporangium sp. NBC_01737]